MRAAAPQLIDEYVVHDREQPGPQIAPRAPQVALVDRTLERVLHEIVGGVLVADERARIAAQPRDVLGDPLGIHVGYRSALDASGTRYAPEVLERFARLVARLPSLPET